MSSSGERKSAVKKLKNLFFTSKSEVKEYRENMDQTFGDVFVPNRVEVSEREIGGVVCDVLNPEIYNSRRVMIYIHGGCFVGGSRQTYRSLAASLANVLNCRAVVPEFRLAPTHPYPAAIDDVQNVFRGLYAEEFVACSLDGAGKSKPEFILAADGSGASVAMALLQNFGEHYRSVISQIFLLSPWLDVSTDSKILNAKKSQDDLITGESVRRAAELYTFQDNRGQFFVSPLKAAADQLKNLPPVFIQCGDKELMADDCVKFYTMLKEAGNDAVLDSWPEMMSMFQMADEYLEESHLAIERIGKFFTERNNQNDLNNQ